MSRKLIFLVSVSIWCLLVRMADSTDCAAAGRYPNVTDSTCRGFIICIGGAAGTFSQYGLNCPQEFVFNPSIGTCTNSANYTCPTLNSSDYSCGRTGNFTNPFVKDCRTFISCFSHEPGVLIPRISECTKGELFEPVQGECIHENLYRCGSNRVGMLSPLLFAFIVCIMIN